jgi:hypothetical protein
MGKQLLMSWQKESPCKVKDKDVNERKVKIYSIPGTSEVVLREGIKKKSFWNW